MKNYAVKVLGGAHNVIDTALEFGQLLNRNLEATGTRLFDKSLTREEIIANRKAKTEANIEALQTSIETYQKNYNDKKAEIKARRAKEKAERLAKEAEEAGKATEEQPKEETVVA